MVTRGAKQGHRMLVAPNMEVGTWLGSKASYRSSPGLD